MLLQAGFDITRVSKLVKAKYNRLADYLESSAQLPPNLRDYFSWYRLWKIKNACPTDTSPDVNIDCYSHRNKMIMETHVENPTFLWIDGMGIEWLPALSSELEKLEVPGKCVYQIASASIPTTTEYNEQWNDYHGKPIKWNRLDKLAHHGVLDDEDYYSCIAYQLEIISEVAREAVKLAVNHNVIITADHGTSRLAALRFHSDFHTLPPEKCKVGPYGRYCIIGNEPNNLDFSENIEYQNKDGMHYLVWKTHDHYKKSGKAHSKNVDEEATVGEIHGGMTPEECLVPFVIIYSENYKNAIHVEIPSECVQESETTEIILKFDKEIKSLIVSANGKEGRCSSSDNRLWNVSFVALQCDEFIPTILADGHKVESLPIAVKKQGIEIKELF